MRLTGAKPGPESRTATNTPIRFSFGGGDQHLPQPLSKITHRLDRIDDHIEQHLLQLDPISANERQALRKLHVHGDAALRRFAAGQGNDLANRSVDLDVIRPGRLFLDESADPIDDRTSSNSTLDRTIQCLSDFLQISMFGVQPVQGDIGVGDCRRDRLVDFMRNGRRSSIAAVRATARVNRDRAYFARRRQTAPQVATRGDDAGINDSLTVSNLR